MGGRRHPLSRVTSDTHYESGEPNNLDGWLTDLAEVYTELDYMGVGGDIASTTSTSIDEYWEFVQDIIDTIDAHDDFVPNGGIYTTGNHEQYAGPNAGGDYEVEKDSNDTAQLMIQNGEAARRRTISFTVRLEQRRHLAHGAGIHRRTNRHAGRLSGRR